MTIQQLRMQQTEVDRKIADLSARYTSSYPGLIDAERDKRALDARIAAEVGRIADSIRNDYETAVSRRDELKKMLGTAGRHDARRYQQRRPGEIARGATDRRGQPGIL